MRYRDSGGLTAPARAKPEQVRRQAADWFAEGVPAAEVTRRLRVSATAVYGWQQRWRQGGVQDLASIGYSTAAYWNERTNRTFVSPPPCFHPRRREPPQ